MKQETNQQAIYEYVTSEYNSLKAKADEIANYYRLIVMPRRTRVENITLTKERVEFTIAKWNSGDIDDTYEHAFPASILFAEEWKPLIEECANSYKKNQQENAHAAAIKLAEQKTEADRKEYERLKAIFG